MLGHVGSDVAHVWIKASSAGEASLLISDHSDLAGATTHQTEKLEAGHDFMSTLSAPSLSAGKRYFYAIALDGKIVTPRPYPSFTTAPPDGAPAHQRFAFTSCLGRTGSASAAAWGQMEANANADLILLLGDDHYADTTAREGQLNAYVSHRSVPAYRAISAQIPSYNIWDDHDYGRMTAMAPQRARRSRWPPSRTSGQIRATGNPTTPASTTASAAAISTSSCSTSATTARQTR